MSGLLQAIEIGWRIHQATRRARAAGCTVVTRFGAVVLRAPAGPDRVARAVTVVGRCNDMEVLAAVRDMDAAMTSKLTGDRPPS